MPLPKEFLAKGRRAKKPAAAAKPPKKKRGARGLGSTWQDEATGLWKSKVPVGRYADGGTKYKWLSGPTQADVVAQRKALKPPAADVTVREWAERWFKSLGISAPAKGDYRNTLDVYVIPTFGDRALASLTAHDVEAAAASWSKAGGGALGPNTLRKNLGHLRSCLQAARRAKLIPDNPVADAKKPKKKRPRIDPFDAAELSRILDAGCAEGGDPLFALLAGIGCRYGEALALDVSDFDAAAGAVAITKTYCSRYGLRRPKSENGVRTVPLPAALVPALERARGGRAAGPLFVAQQGGRRHAGRGRAGWKKALAALGLRYRNPHQLRHSVATAWIAAGVGVGDVARGLGDTVQTVVTTYVHPTAVNTARVMDAVLEGGRKVARDREQAAAHTKIKRPA